MQASPTRVVLVDDEEAVRRGLERLLKCAGFSVVGFASGESFLVSLKSSTPDCLLLDLHMPKLDGFAVLKRLAALTPKFPVLVITGNDTRESREKATAFGAAAYLAKPLDELLLLETITSLLARAPPRPPEAP